MRELPGSVSGVGASTDQCLSTHSTISTLSVGPNAYHPNVQGSGPLRQGEIPPWHKRTTVRAEKQRLLSTLAQDDKANTRDNNDIRLSDAQQARVSAMVLIECFTPSNISDLYASIDDWPIRPPEYLESLKDEVRKWRTSEYGGAWRHVALFAPPDSTLFEYSADPTIPDQIRAIDVILTSPLPSLTTVIATFYFSDDRSNLADDLRKYFVPRIGPLTVHAKGRIARYTHRLPFSRAKNIYYNLWISDARQLQREHVDNIFSEMEAYCWRWFSQLALGKVGALPIELRPSIRCILLDNLEPFGPVDLKPQQDDPRSWRDWYDSDSEEPYRGERRGPLEALGLNSPVSTWTTKERDSFYFSMQSRFDDLPLKASLAANRSTIVRALEMEGEPSDLNIFDQVVRNHCLGLFSALTIGNVLDMYKEEISSVRDSSASSQSAYRIAKMLNDFLVRDGHDAAVIARDAAKRSDLEYSFRETPPFVELLEIRRSARRSGEGTPDDEREFLIKRFRRDISNSAKYVGTELTNTTSSISSSATLLQSMATIRLQYWSIGVAVLATVIAVIAIIAS